VAVDPEGAGDCLKGATERPRDGRREERTAIRGRPTPPGLLRRLRGRGPVARAADGLSVGRAAEKTVAAAAGLQAEKDGLGLG